MLEHVRDNKINAISYLRRKLLGFEKIATLS